MSNISSLSSSNASSNAQRPSDAFVVGSWAAEGSKLGEKRPREAVGRTRLVDNNPLEEDDVALAPVDEVQFEKTEQKKDPIENATMDDVVFTLEFVNPHKRINPKKPRSEKDFTRLVSIGSVSAKALLLDDLKRFASRVGITGSRAWGKQRVCEAIVDNKMNPKKKEATKKKKAAIVNRKRFINVLFDEVFLPKLSTRGQSLNKDQLTDGLKTDELLFRDFIVLYNNKDDFNEDEHPDLGVKGDPSSFDPIDWETARKFFRGLMKDYDICLANWKRSGNHGGFGDNQNKPFSDFKKNRGDMLYLHEFAHQVPDVLKHVITQLNSDTFFESISDDDEGGTAVGSELAKLATSSKKKKKQTPRKSSSSSSDTVASAILAMSNDAKTRNKIQKYAFVVESELNTSKAIREMRKEWKKVVADASKARKNVSSHYIQKEYKKFKHAKENPRKRTAVDEVLDRLNDSDSDGDTSEESESNLDSVFEELYEIDLDIEKAKRRQKHLEREADGIENDNGGNKENKGGNDQD